MISLLDVNVLIALIVQDHPFHEGASAFFKQALANGWATCPLTENAVLRIVAGGSLSGPTPTVQEMREQFAKYLAMPGHQFWPDDVSLMDARSFPSLAGARALTDIYLLGLAVKHGGRLATFDRLIDPSLVPGGPAAYFLIPLP